MAIAAIVAPTSRHGILSEPKYSASHDTKADTKSSAASVAETTVIASGRKKGRSFLIAVGYFTVSGVLL